MIKLSTAIVLASASYFCYIQTAPEGDVYIPSSDTTPSKQCSNKIKISVSVENNIAKDPIFVVVTDSQGQLISSSSGFVTNTTGLRVKKAYLCYEGGETINIVTFRSGPETLGKPLEISSEDAPRLLKIVLDRQYQKITPKYKSKPKS